MDKNELYHYGVLGMKWGRRKAAKSSGKPGKKSKRDGWSDDAKNAAAIKSKKNVKKMSNAELKQLNERGRLEREYSSLNPGKIKKGMAFVTGAAAVTGTIVALHKNGGQMIDAGKNFCSRLSYKQMTNW